MFYKIKNRIDKELVKFMQTVDKNYRLSSISPLLFNSIKEFVLRDGKRTRPILFVVGYLGFAGKKARYLYRSALSVELLHDFMLIHDDIIDKSDLRRGKPSMHKMLNNYLKPYKNIKFNGQDLSIVIGDVMHALAIDAFLSIKEPPERKEKALRKFIEATLYTGSGEFIELTSGLLSIEELTKQEIYKIYDCKTAYYTFSVPLSAGSLLAGASKLQADKLSKFGVSLGRAFQIKDDILGMFGDEKEIGKSVLSDLQEAKKTILIWQAYSNTNKANKSIIKNILSKNKVNKSDLYLMRKLIKESGSLSYAKGEISLLLKEAQAVIKSSTMRSQYKNFLCTYSQDLLNCNMI